MNARQIAKTHFEAALAEAGTHGIDADSVARYTLSLVVEAFLAQPPSCRRAGRAAQRGRKCRS